MIDGLIRVAYVNEYTRSDHNEMLAIVWATKKREISSILSMNQRHVIKNRLALFLENQRYCRSANFYLHFFIKNIFRKFRYKYFNIN